VVHRDIKPGNLLVDRSGIVKITDFGIAYALGSAPLTRTGNLIGTPAYLAPERINGQAAGPPSDLYSLGMVAYECLTGSLPFTGTAVEIALAHQRQTLPPLPAAVPREVAGLIAQLTARDPARRPASAAAVADRARVLRDALGEPTSGADADTGPADIGGGGGDVWEVSQPGMHDRTLTDISYPGEPWPPVPPMARRRSRKGAALAAAAIAVVAGLAGWVLANATGSDRPPGQVPASHSSTNAGRSVTVDATALVGQPVRGVVSQLKQLGLQVTVSWQPANDQKPGRVLSVTPSGSVPVGTTVVVTGASRANGEHHGDGHGNNQGHD